MLKTSAIRLIWSAVFAAAQMGLSGQVAIADANVVSSATQPSISALAAPAAPAVTRNFPGVAPCNTTLQDCISGSNDNDVILIAPNTYTASLNITRAVSLIGNGATPQSVILRGSGNRAMTISAPGMSDRHSISNMTIADSTSATGSGGGIRINTGSGAPIFSNLVITNNRTIFADGGGGGIRVIPNIPITMINVSVISNTAPGDGGGISVSGPLFLLNGQVERNTSSTKGGGIWVGGNIEISGTLFSKNGAPLGGGAALSSTVRITNTTWINNIAGSMGGAIYASDPNVTVTLRNNSGTRFTMLSNNQAITGGAIYAAGTVNIAGQMVFGQNKATTGEGGAIYATRVTDDFPNTTAFQWTGNTAGGHGGAIRALQSVSMCPGGPSFFFNKAGAAADGGAIYADSIFLCGGRGSGPYSVGNTARFGGAFYGVSSVFLNGHDVGANNAQVGGCVFSQGSITFNSANAEGCVSLSDGGAALAPTVTIQGNGVGRFLNNLSGGAGGVVRGTVVTIKDAQFVSNTANSGGAVSAVQELHISNSTFSTNTAQLGGGAGGVGAFLYVTDSIFINNTVTDTLAKGGALSIGDQGFIIGSIFERNRARQGGAVFGGFANGVWITGSTFVSNSTTGTGNVGGAVHSVLITATHSHFQGNSASGGGAISSTVALIHGSYFTQNTALNGGAITATLATVRDSVFVSNTATQVNTGSGGGLLMGSGRVEGSRFVGNGADDEGSALFARSNTSVISESQFIRNGVVCCSFGSATAFANGGTVIDSIFDGNEDDGSIDRGGALNSLAGTLYVRGGQFLNNRAYSGGAIGASNVDISGTHFYNNIAKCCGEGGAIVMNGGQIRASTFISNYADCCGGGGAIYSFGSVFIASSQFFSNAVESRMDGGAVYARGHGSIVNSEFGNNKVLRANSQNFGTGGAVYFGAREIGTNLISSSWFTGNAANHGGAVVCEQRCTIDSSHFERNLALFPDTLTFANIGSGGAIESFGDLVLKKNVFLRNGAGANGGAVHQTRRNVFQSTDAIYENNLFAQNSVSNSLGAGPGQAVWISGTINGGKLLFNTIVADGIPSVSAIALLTGTVSVINNIFSGHGIALESGTNLGIRFENFNLFFSNTFNLSGTLNSGGSSLTGDPIFAAPSSDNYRLMAASAALDVGTDVFVVEDIDGQFRPHGAGFDTGFDERVAQSQTLSFDPVPDQNVNVGSVTLLAVATSGLPIRFLSNSPLVCLVTGNLVTLLGAGMCSITAVQSGDAQFDPAPSVTRSFTITGVASSSSLTYLPMLQR